MPRNWNEHYQQPENVNLTPVALLVEVADSLPPGRALDLACGPGRNALYLARLGWEVDAVDASSTAIHLLRAQAAAEKLRLETYLADLEAGQFTIAPGAYGLICDFYYLERRLFPLIREGVRPGGVFTAAIHVREEGSHSFVLEPGELRAEFDAWKILFYSESRQPGGKLTAQIIARRA